jgi:hypothetical protein
MHQVTFSNDADDPAFSINDGYRTDVLLEKRPGDIAYGSVDTNGDHWRNHYVPGEHGQLPVLHGAVNGGLIAGYDGRNAGN